VNVSTVNNDDTARTNIECAYQRAENLAILGVKTVLELCVGPSLKVLEHAYKVNRIKVTGNDIDPRWMLYYKTGDWIIGDALKIDYSGFDAVVFAPPLSRGCTGTREDALSINQVVPRYIDFMRRPFNGVRCMVLPARTFATRLDRKEFFDLTFDLTNPEIIPLTAGSRKIRKYVDVYYQT
jgi:hypothetical protein